MLVRSFQSVLYDQDGGRTGAQGVCCCCCFVVVALWLSCLPRDVMSLISMLAQKFGIHFFGVAGSPKCASLHTNALE